MTSDRANRFSRTSLLWAVLLVLAVLAVGMGYLSLARSFASPQPTLHADLKPTTMASPTVQNTPTQVPLSSATAADSPTPAFTQPSLPAPTTTDAALASETRTAEMAEAPASTPPVTVPPTPTLVVTTPITLTTTITPALTTTATSAVSSTVQAVATLSPTSTATPTVTPTATSIPTPKPLPQLNPDGHVGLGVYLPEIPYDDFDSVGRFEQKIEHRVLYISWYQAWADPDRDFPGRLVGLVASRGSIPMITWEPWKRDFDNPGRIQAAYTLDTIVNGSHDEYIRTWARAAAEAGVPLILRFAHEQSTPPGERRWYPWQGDPEAYKAAFRHVVTIFREEGATNVEFLWSAMWLDQWAPQYYPGDDYVDLVGTTVLNHGTVPSADWALWRTFDDLFSGQHEAARQWNKPVIITEWATAEQGGDKAAWLADSLASLNVDYPLVEGVILFEVPSDREFPAIDWTVGSSANALAAFKRAIRDPYFK